jgi:hypothetical protein
LTADICAEPDAMASAIVHKHSIDLVTNQIKILESKQTIQGYQERKPKTIPMPPKQAKSTGKTKSSSVVWAGRRKYVLDEAGVGQEEHEGINQKEIDGIYNGISDPQDRDDQKEDVKNYILPKETKLEHMNLSKDNTDTNGTHQRLPDLLHHGVSQ